MVMVVRMKVMMVRGGGGGGVVIGRVWRRVIGIRVDGHIYAYGMERGFL